MSDDPDNKVIIIGKLGDGVKVRGMAAAVEAMIQQHFDIIPDLNIHSPFVEASFKGDKSSSIYCFPDPMNDNIDSVEKLAQIIRHSTDGSTFLHKKAVADLFNKLPGMTERARAIGKDWNTHAMGGVRTLWDATKKYNRLFKNFEARVFDATN
jgi:hypothetical protein